MDASERDDDASLPSHEGDADGDVQGSHAGDSRAPSAASPLPLAATPTSATPSNRRGRGAKSQCGPPPVSFSSFPSLMEAARQQTDMVCWLSRKIHEHDEKIRALVVARPTTSFNARMSDAGADAATRPALAGNRPDGKPSLLEAFRKRTPVPSAQSPEFVASEERALPSAASGAGASLAGASATGAEEAQVPEARMPSHLTSEERAAEAAAAAAAAARAKAKAEGKSDAEVAAAAAGASAAFAASAAARATTSAAAVARMASAGGGGAAEGGEGGAQGEGMGMHTVLRVEELSGLFRGHEAETQQRFEETAAALDGCVGDLGRKMEELASFVQGELGDTRASVQEEVNAAVEEAVEQAVQQAVQRLMPEKMGNLDEEIRRIVEEQLRLRGGVGGAEAAPGDTAGAPATKEAVGRGSSKRGRLSSNSVAAPAPAGAAEPEAVASLRSAQAVIEARMPALEDAAAHLKELRLEIPDIRNEMDELRQEIARLTDSWEGRGESPRQRDSLDDFGAEDQGGAASGAHPPPGPRASMAAAMGNYMREQGGRSPAPGAASIPAARLTAEEITSLLEAAGGMQEAERKIRDAEQLTSILEDRLKELDTDFRTTSGKLHLRLDQITAKVQLEELDSAKISKVWNLSNQVDVIQSVVNQEMLHVRRSVEHMVDRKLIGFDVSGSARGSPGGSNSATTRVNKRLSNTGQEAGAKSDTDSAMRFQELEEKVRMLQQANQQNTLKIAGLTTAAKRTDDRASSAAEQVKKLAESSEGVLEQVARHDVRLDYLTLHSAPGLGGAVGDATTFAAATGVADLASPRGPRRLAPAAAAVGVIASPRGSSKPRRSSLTGAPAVQLLSPTAGPGVNLSPVLSPSAAGAVPGAAGGEDTAGAGGDRRRTHMDIGDDLQMRENTRRIARFGQMLFDMDRSMDTQFGTLQEELDRQAHQLAQIIAFLPRRQRRTVERIVAEHTKGPPAEEDPKKDDEEEKGPPKKEDGKKKIGFQENAEVRHYQVEEDTVMPWQEVGAPDQKWSWCSQSLNEMGRELARHLEQMEHEHAEFENDVQNALERLQQDVRSRGAKGGTPVSNTRMVRTRTGTGTLIDDEAFEGAGDATPAEAISADKMSKRLEKAIIPQLASLEERIERLAAEAREQKRAQETKDAKKVDREEFQLVHMRLALFDRLDPRLFDSRLSSLEEGAREVGTVLEVQQEKMQSFEVQFATRSCITKVNREISTLKAEMAHLSNEVKNTVASTYNSNRHNTTALGEMRDHLEKQVAKLNQEKVNTKDFGEMQDKVVKLELSVRDNRTILGDGNNGGGGEINTLVKRIILNMEDKLMVLEKKVDALIESRGVDVEQLLDLATGTAQSRTGSPGRAVSNGASPRREGGVQSIGSELQNLNQAIVQLKQEISLSRLDIEQISEAGHQQMELAQRLQVSVEGAGDENGETGGTAALSLSRVQVMISAAARQLVAGSKWITKETFDFRMGEFRKEYMSGSRHLQSQLEDLGAALVSMKNNITAFSSAGPSVMHSANTSAVRLLPKMLQVKRPGESDALEWPEVAEKVGALRPMKDRQSSHHGGAVPPPASGGGNLLPRPSPRVGRPSTRA